MRLLALGCVALLTGACTSSTPAPAGVLLGLTSGRTLWIAWPNDTARLITETPHLVIPRDDGMWWAGVARRCTLGEGGGGWVEDTVFVFLEEAVFVAPPGEDAHVTLSGMPCDQAERGVLAARAEAPSTPSETEAADESPPSREELYCSNHTRRITYASPTTLSLEIRHIGTDFCSPASYATSGANRVRRLDSNERIMLRPLLDSAALAPLLARFNDSVGCGYVAEDPAAEVDSAWAIGRHEGRWVARLWVEGPNFCRGGQDTEGGPPLPASFTGDSTPPIAWTDVVRQLPNVFDAAVSPSGTHILARRSDSLMILPLKDGNIGAPLLTMHIGYDGELSMIRWATEKEAARWTRTLPTLQPPTVHIMPDTLAPPR